MQRSRSVKLSSNHTENTIVKASKICGSNLDVLKKALVCHRKDSMSSAPKKLEFAGDFATWFGVKIPIPHHKEARAILT